MHTYDILAPYQYSAVNTLVETLHGAFSKLNMKISARSLEKVAITLYEAMSTRNRAYHRVEHCLNIPSEFSPIATIAYLFHDIVYWQIDRARHPIVRQYMTPYLPNEDGVVDLCESIDYDDLNVSEPGVLSRLVFGFEKRAQIAIESEDESGNGVNEFLSACVVENILKGVLMPWQIVQVVACIEATIPFRLPKGGKTAQDLLRERLTHVAKMLKLRVSQDEIRNTMKMTVDVALHDLSNFSINDSGLFLKNSWDIIWERNFFLQRETYTVQQYRKALQSNESMLQSLNPHTMFPFLKNYPSHTHLEQLIDGAVHNLTVANEYLQAKLIAAAVVEAVAEETGGDAPIILFMGRHPVFGLLDLWRELISDLPYNDDKTTERYEVQLLLQTGRSGGKEKFDVSQSPIAAYLFSHLDEMRFKNAVAQAKLFFEKKIKGDQFLCGVVYPYLDPILARISKIALSRRELVLRLTDRLAPKKAA